MDVSPTSVTVYHEWTSNCWGNEVRNGRCTTCWEPASTMAVYQYSRVRTAGNVTVRVSIPDVVDTEELLSEPYPPWHRAHARYTPRVKPVVPVWKQRQVLKQQRPRDGLR